MLEVDPFTTLRLPVKSLEYTVLAKVVPAVIGKPYA